jgi:colanic acid/amylovoran biosynthesis glycosyltransferase
VESLVAAIKQVLSSPPEDLERMGMAGRARVLQDHSIDIEATRLGQYFMNTAEPELGFTEG